MKENPFQMADDIWGIGFKTADGIAQKLGFAKEAYVRLRSGIMYTLSNLADEGHVFAYQEQLIAKAAELLEAEESSIVMTLDQMIMDKDLICETVDYNTDQAEMKAIYLPAFYYAEAGGRQIKTSGAGTGSRPALACTDGCTAEDRKRKPVH